MKFPCGNEDHRISTIIQIYIHFRATLRIPGDSMHCTRGLEGWNRISRWGVDVDVLVHGLPVRFLIWPAQREDLSNSYPGISWEPIDPMNLAMEEITETDDQPWDLFPGKTLTCSWDGSSRFFYSQSTELKTICNSSSSSRSSTEAMLHALSMAQNFWDHRMVDRSCTPPASFASPPPGSPPCQPSTLAWGFYIPWPYRSNESIFVSACHLLRLKWGVPPFFIPNYWKTVLVLKPYGFLGIPHFFRNSLIQLQLWASPYGQVLPSGSFWTTTTMEQPWFSMPLGVIWLCMILYADITLHPKALCPMSKSWVWHGMTHFYNIILFTNYHPTMIQLSNIWGNLSSWALGRQKLQCLWVLASPFHWFNRSKRWEASLVTTLVANYPRIVSGL